MLFNSWIFAVFFCVVGVAYYASRRTLRAQNWVLLVASYIFYGAWDYRFLALLVASTTIDYFIARAIDQAVDARRQRLLLVSVVTNLTILGFFKYYNFFVDGMTELLVAVGLPAPRATLEVVLPVGISFYTFQAMSYTIDVYRRQLSACRDFVDFALYVAFFPQLVAGPIERATALIPQIITPRRVTWSHWNIGIHLILWGLFKKVVIADNAAAIANRIFNDYSGYHGLDLWLAALAFTLQIYCDFSGYSDIARGSAKMLGFDLMLNFKLPYLASNPSEFWRRWHVSLSQWLRDYLYVPLGGNRKGTMKTYRNLMLTMVLGGLWHGAAWNFVLWGTYHGTLLCAHRALGVRGWLPRPRTGAARLVTKASSVALMFALTVIGWVLFRCRSATEIGYFFTEAGLTVSGTTATTAGTVLLLAAPLVAMQAAQYQYDDLAVAVHLRPLLRGLFWLALVVMMLVFGVRESVEFIYFQF